MLSLLALALLTCGNERWDVKTLTDKDAASVVTDLAQWSAADVPSLRTAKVPFKSWSNTLPRFDSEKVVWQITADVTAFKVEDDQDIHIVLADPANHKVTMIAEIPSPDCMENSPVKDPVAQARADFQTIFGTLPKTIGKLHTLKQAVTVHIAGVMFFDKLHGQTGVAPNGVELHPVLLIEKGTTK